VGSIRGELEEVGANYVDEALVIDGNLITSRVPGDLPVFSKAIEEAIKKAR
jgi:protease I